ncbi:GVQW3 protein, partial [Acromyrmex heyeri]
MDQRICIKFCVKNKIKCADAFRMLTVAYGEATLDRSNVYRWYKMFSEGREDVNDEERAGRPSTSTTDEISELKRINKIEIYAKPYVKVPVQPFSILTETSHESQGNNAITMSEQCQEETIKYFAGPIIYILYIAEYSAKTNITVSN